MRRKRHDFIYDSKNNITISEAKSSIETAIKLINKISVFIKEQNPQKKLF